jgi:EAL and modified HD-GYP domain-containing signal transduction protein
MVWGVTHYPDAPRVWHLPHADIESEPAIRRVLLGRQGIFSAERELRGFELLFRAPGRDGLRIDLWNARQQDRATEHVLAAAFFGGPDVSEGLPLFVNFTRSYLVNREGYLRPPHEIVLEVVESAHADASLFDRLAELRAAGYRIAIDDFLGTDSQRRLLNLADFVKIDYRDLTARGPRLVDAARTADAMLIAERVETEAMFDECRDLGFEQFQGHLFEVAVILERTELAADAARA